MSDYRSGRSYFGGPGRIFDEIISTPFRIMDAATCSRERSYCLPIDNFDDMSTQRAVRAVCYKDLSKDELYSLAGYELNNRRRRYVLEAIRRKIKDRDNKWIVGRFADTDSDAAAVAFIAANPPDFWDVQDLIRFERDAQNRGPVLDVLLARLDAVVHPAGGAIAHVPDGGRDEN